MTFSSIILPLYIKLLDDLARTTNLMNCLYKKTCEMSNKIWLSDWTFQILLSSTATFKFEFGKALLGWNQHKSLMFHVQRMISTGFLDSNSKRSERLVAKLNHGSKIPRLVQHLRSPSPFVAYSKFSTLFWLIFFEVDPMNIHVVFQLLLFLALRNFELTILENESYEQTCLKLVFCYINLHSWHFRLLIGRYISDCLRQRVLTLCLVQT